MKKFAVLFDMDGVIVDSNPVHKIAIERFCKKYDLELSEEKLSKKVWGRQNKDWIPAVFERDIEPALLAEYSFEKEKLFRELYETEIKPLPGLENFLKQLEEKEIPKAIATSAPIENVDFVLERTGLRKYFQTILHDAFVEKGKPDPEIYLKTAEALNFDPKDCIVFEDSLSGVQSGLSAGCKVVGVLTTHSPQELKETHLTIKDFNEITIEALGNLFR